MSAGPAFATHIVGGEFELQYLQRERYRLRLILYNDDINGNPGAIDPNAQVYIWSKRNNQLMQIVNLPYRSREDVPYTNPACAIARLKTSKVVYSSDITLREDFYNDEEGYYVTYERCCRNNIINNIVRPDASGQTFYLEFPPVVNSNGESFVNSSPVLFPPLSDFARLGYPFFFDFRGTDPDGDSLVYKLATPIAGFSSPDFPIPSSPNSAPYPGVTWATGYSVSNMVPGNPALQIDKGGYLRVKPDREGLFVFSVLAEEFREGVKIGEVRRDFQMLVYNVAGEDFPPVLVAEKADGQIFRDHIKVVDADFPVAGQDRCLSLKVTDEDIQAEDGFTENLRFRVVGDNFSGAGGVTLSVQQGTVTSNAPELFLNVCLPECPPVFTQPYRFSVVAYDDVCSVPMTDTLHVEVSLTPPANEPAHFVNLANSQLSVRQGTHNMPVVQEGDVYDFIVEGFDADGDDLEFNWVPQGFDAQQWGFSINKIDEVVAPDGQRKVRWGVRWEAVCSAQRDFGVKDKFTFRLALDDKPDCDQHRQATYDVSFGVELPGSLPPDVTTSINNFQQADELDMEVLFEQPLTFLVKSEDPDVDQLNLRAVGAGFDLEDYGMSFTGGTGVGTVQGDFSWIPGCGNIDTSKDVFKVYFISQDAALCKRSMADTIEVNIRVNYPTNFAPQLSARVAEGDNIERLELFVGEEVSILLRGIDANKVDGLLLSLQNIESPNNAINYNWQDVSGTGEVSSLLSFTADCDLLQGESEAMVSFSFNLEDSPCLDKKSDNLTLQILVKDRQQDFDPVRFVNVFTPNGDRCNPYFEIKDLPEDNCYNRFEYVRVYNRWGKLVFESNERNFRWDGEGYAVGTYYYLLKYTNQTYRSPLSLLLGDPAFGADCAN
ncbi:gliding motility-associated C-terminal domain-containing protein [Cesiribacter sp. SM1]|uniref:T9SS type B sorting domain-containing protein n=1 Tax=Cesiribacter sp. SM1 TaxID=2861196 RepID=UPI001CD30AD9